MHFRQNTCLQPSYLPLSGISLHSKLANPRGSTTLLNTEILNRYKFRTLVVKNDCSGKVYSVNSLDAIILIESEVGYK